MTAQKITPCLSFDFRAEEAVEQHLSVFENACAIFEMKKLDVAKIRQAYYGQNQEEES
jgi:predicted 3-demethylubiquinone-9 3-methyltransferase (glyoxalase superfamily)